MTRGPTGWTDRSYWVRISSEGSRELQGAGAARDDEQCRQCHFPWFMHPERYDPEEDAFVRCCSEYPVLPVPALEACIAP